MSKAELSADVFFYCISCGCNYALGPIIHPVQLFSREQFLTTVCLGSILQGKKIVLFGLPVSALSVGFLDVLCIACILLDLVYVICLATSCTVLIHHLHQSDLEIRSSDKLDTIK